jgi:hypothetical protein
MNPIKQAVLDLLLTDALTVLGELRPDAVLGVELSAYSRRLWNADTLYAAAVADRAAAVDAAHADATARWERRVHAAMRARYTALVEGGVALLEQVARHPALPSDLGRWGLRQVAKARAAGTPSGWAVAYAVLLLQSSIDWELAHSDADDAADELYGEALHDDQARFVAWAELAPDAYAGLNELRSVTFDLAPPHAGAAYAAP